MLRSEITTTKVLTPESRAAAMEVIDAVYRHEKRWIADSDAEIPTNLPERADVSWFVTHVGDTPAGVIRLAYDPPLSIPPELDFHFERDIALDRLPP
ncbi:MAG: GNAT family N-acetyltransferase, partial [Acidobacteria bacterium]|nr:GNAT family N-acetyltransferase [Acidobacteriota bacterium]